MQQRETTLRDISVTFLTFRESVVMLMEGFFAVTAVLEPHLLLRLAAAPDSCSPSVPPVPGDNLQPGKITIQMQSFNSHTCLVVITMPCTHAHTNIH